MHTARSDSLPPCGEGTKRLVQKELVATWTLSPNDPAYEHLLMRADETSGDREHLRPIGRDRHGDGPADGADRAEVRAFATDRNLHRDLECEGISGDARLR